MRPARAPAIVSEISGSHISPFVNSSERAGSTPAMISGNHAAMAAATALLRRPDQQTKSFIGVGYARVLTVGYSHVPLPHFPSPEKNRLSMRADA
jgi:hypothetical protein